jgi:CRISPR/Cas system-associated endonuclease Cas1
MGAEGRAAARYWQAVAMLIPAELNCRGARHRVRATRSTRR